MKVEVQMSGDAATQQDFTVAWAGLTLAGTLHLPPGPPPHPAILMLQGSGASDREAAGYFRSIREPFLARGIATIAFDKPGCGASTGDWRDYALTGRAEQAEAIFGWLRQNPAIDPKRIGVWGQSQGGWLVQLLAARLPWLGCAIANSGPAIGVEAQDRAGCEHTMRAQGKDEATIARAIAFIDAVHAAARRGETFAAVEPTLLAPARGQPWADYLTLDSAADWEGTCRFVTEAYDPMAALRQIRCPLLAIFGTRDVLVPAWESAILYDRAMQETGHPDCTVALFPQGNHRIRDEATGEFCTGYLDLLADWAAQRLI